MTRRFGSPQIRNVATLVGNIAHGSPVADSLCLLADRRGRAGIDRRARHSARGDRRLPSRARKQTDPRRRRDHHARPDPAAGPRRDRQAVQDLQAEGDGRLDLPRGHPDRAARRRDRVGRDRLLRASARPSAGCPRTEAFLAGRPFSEATFREAGRLARAEVEPISDVRGSRDFRLRLAENILLKFYHEATPERRSARRTAGPGRIRSDRDRSGAEPSPPTAARSAGRSRTNRPGARDGPGGLPRRHAARLATSCWSSSSAARWPMRGSSRSTSPRRAQVEGIAAVFTAADVPGDNQFGPIFHDEEVLAARECHHIGQPIVVLAGESRAALRAARAAVRIELEALPAVLSIDEAIAGRHFIGPTRRIARGDADGRTRAGRARPRGDLPHRRPGAFLPGDPGRARDPRRGRADHHPLVDPEPERDPGGGGPLPRPAAEPGRLHLHADGGRVRRQGVAGRPSRAAGGPGRLKTGRPARIVYSRDLDMRVTGKRHPYLSRYKVGFDSDGRIKALDARALLRRRLRGRPLAGGLERSMLHADNAYFIPEYRRHRDGLPDEPAVEHGDARLRRPAGDRGDRERHRGDRGPPGHRRRSRSAGGTVYGGAGRDTTPYGQVVANNTLPTLLDRLAETSDYARRRAEVARFNAASRTHVRGLALTPVKFGISFTRRTLNQANALVNIYLDGTIQVSTGGTEMGQGLNTKIAPDRRRRSSRCRSRRSG